MGDITGFFNQQSDYYLMLKAFSFLLLASISGSLRTGPFLRLPWAYLILFAILEAGRALLDLYAPLLGDAVFLDLTRLSFFLVAMASLAEFGRQGYIDMNLRVPGPWIYLPFLGLAALLIVNGYSSISIDDPWLRLTLMVPACASTVGYLLRFGKNKLTAGKFGAKRLLSFAALAFSLYGIRTVITIPGLVGKALGMSADLPIAFVIIAFSTLMWFAYNRAELDASRDASRDERRRNLTAIVMLFLFIAVLVGAWLVAVLIVKTREGRLIPFTLGLIASQFIIVIMAERYKVQTYSRIVERNEALLEAQVEERTDKLRVDELRLESLLRISQLKTRDPGELYEFALNEAIALTRSTIGYAFRYDESTRVITLDTHSQGLMDGFGLCEDGKEWTLEETGLWGEAARQRKPVLINHFHEDLPPGKESLSPIKRVLSVPILNGDTLLGVIGVANKKTEYDLADIRQLKLLIDATVGIAEKSKAELAILEAQDRLKVITDNLPVAVFQIAGERLDELQITFMGERLQAITAIPVETLNGSVDNLLKIVHKEDLPGLYASMHQALNRKKAWRYEYRIVMPDGGSRWNRGEARPLRTDKGLVWNGFFEDITERREMEEALRKAKDEAEAAARAKSSFLANVSHEIRTPMNAIAGLIHLALESPFSDKLPEYLHKIQSSSGALLALINDILDVSKIEAGKLDIENLAFMPDKVILNVVGMFSASAEQKGIELACRVHPGIPEEVRGDSFRLQQVLINIVANAIKFTERGKVEIEARVGETRGDFAILDFFIRDSGIGIPEEKRDELFKPFTQADGSMTRRFGGTGLGLAISSQLTKLMGGAISVESVLGMGSTFKVSIPFQIVKNPSRDHKSNKQPEANLTGLRVLVVEDNALNRQIAYEILTSLGVLAETVEDGASALMLLERRGAKAFDALLMDIQMPGMDGYQTTKALRSMSDFENIPIIAVTAHTFETERAACFDVGMSDHLEKPLDMHKLKATLSKWARPDTAPQGKAASKALAGPRDFEVPKGLRDIEEGKGPEVEEIPQEVDAERAKKLESIVAIDAEEALNRLGGNAEIYERLLVKFRVDHYADAEAIGKAISSGDFSNAAFIAHAIKGVSANLAAKKVTEAAAILEKSLKESIQADSSATLGETTPQAELLLTNLKATMSDLFDLIDSVLQKNK